MSSTQMVLVSTLQEGDVIGHFDDEARVLKCNPATQGTITLMLRVFTSNTSSHNEVVAYGEDAEVLLLRSASYDSLLRKRYRDLIGDADDERGLNDYERYLGL